MRGINAEIEGAKIGERHYNLYYKYNVIQDIIHFPIIIASGDKCFIATNKTDLINFVANPILEKKFEAKVEKMPDCDYKQISFKSLIIEGDQCKRIRRNRAWRWWIGAYWRTVNNNL